MNTVIWIDFNNLPNKDNQLATKMQQVQQRMKTKELVCRLVDFGGKQFRQQPVSEDDVIFLYQSFLTKF